VTSGTESFGKGPVTGDRRSFIQMTPTTPLTAGRIHTSRAATILELPEGATELEAVGRVSGFFKVFHERKTLERVPTAHDQGTDRST
jgi:hypothetical protein